MSGRKSGRSAGASRRLSPVVESLDRRELMTAGGLANSLGPYVSPSPSGPRVAAPAKTVDPHAAIEQLLGSVLGPGLGRIEASSSALGNSPRAVLKQTVLNQAFVHSILSDSDVYTLFGSPALTSLIGSQQVSGVAGTTTQVSTTTSPTATSTSPTATTTSPTVNSTLTAGSTTAAGAQTASTSSFTTPTPFSIPTIPATSTPATSTPTATPTATSTASPTTTSTTTTTVPLIAFSVPQQATIQSVGSTTTLVQVNASGGSPGFFATVPTSNIRIISNGPPITGSVLIPQTSIPTGFPIPSTSFISIGTFAPTYSSTAPLLNEILNAGVKAVAPNAPNAVPGLRLAPFVLKNHPFPAPTSAARKDFARDLRLAVQRNVFTLSTAQSSAVATGISQFAGQVQSMIAAGGFTPAVPPGPPVLPSGTLSGTLEISVGAVRRLLDVNPSVSGLQLPQLGNFPGRLDVGYVFDRAGNYGLMLTVRGPLLNANPVPTPVDVVSGDVRVEVSGATSLGALTGSRVVEGVQVGSGVSADLASSTYGNGVSTFSASAGNGYGLEYGTGVGYSMVIPLGNVNALIPSSPRG